MADKKPLHDASKRIPKSIDTGTHILGNYTLTDLAVGALPGVAVVLASQLFVPPTLTVSGYRVASLTLPLTVVGIALGGLVVYLTPVHLTTIQWFGMIVGFLHRPTRLPHEETMEHTHVAAIHPTHDVIERTDGVFLGLLQVTPPSMALATDREWAAKASSFREFLNTTVEFPIQLYSTTQPFPADEYLAHYEARRSDPDVRSNQQLATLLDKYIEWYRADLDRRRMTIRDHYIVIPVRPDEVRFERRSLTQRLTGVPVLGVFIEALVAPRRDEERAALFEAVDERARLLRHGVREIEGCDAHRVDAETAAELLASFWRGEAVTYDDPAAVITRRPIVATPAESTR
ncbi:hypothetical protein DU500_05940 [Haloplanus rubicundus]|uniref:PrgI family protein n=1 Tax=Haloplanus rubicundus TaxID=1547898 RepID=A0A345E1E9_9EURY|nr:hypothetical protein [Haloplanus rubicundus]AXG06021.1 hypothetical protein DU500_05940 [Haloplanus rubicundus]